eukprot:21719-Rhodomonas_salina.1
MLYTDASASGWWGFISLTESQIQQTTNALLKNLTHKAPSSTQVRVIADLATRGIDTYGAFSPTQQAKS